MRPIVESLKIVPSFTVSTQQLLYCAVITNTTMIALQGQQDNGTVIF